MTDTRTATQELQGQVLETVRKSQEAIVDALQAWTEAISSITPPLPALKPPGADKLPKPGELVAGAYDFAEQLLASQRKFAEDVLEVTGLATAEKPGGPAKKAAAPK